MFIENCQAGRRIRMARRPLLPKDCFFPTQPSIAQRATAASTSLRSLPSGSELQVAHHLLQEWFVILHQALRTMSCPH